MVRTQVQLYLRVRLADGSYPYLRAANAKNGKLKPGFGMYQGRAVEFPGCSYHLRYREGDKRKWEAVGTDASIALVKLAMKKKELGELDEADHGTATVASIRAKGVNESEPVERSEAPARKTAPGKRRLTQCAADYVVSTGIECGVVADGSVVWLKTAGNDWSRGAPMDASEPGRECLCDRRIPEA